MQSSNYKYIKIIILKWLQRNRRTDKPKVWQLIFTLYKSNKCTRKRKTYFGLWPKLERKTKSVKFQLDNIQERGKLQANISACVISGDGKWRQDQRGKCRMSYHCSDTFIRFKSFANGCRRSLNRDRARQETPYKKK